jgi:hypothetical protein
MRQPPPPARCRRRRGGEGRARPRRPSGLSLNLDAHSLAQFVKPVPKRGERLEPVHRAVAQTGTRAVALDERQLADFNSGVAGPVDQRKIPEVMEGLGQGALAQLVIPVEPDLDFPVINRLTEPGAVSLKFGHEGLGVMRVDFIPLADHSSQQGWHKIASNRRQPATQALRLGKTFRRRNGTDRGQIPDNPPRGERCARCCSTTRRLSLSPQRVALPWIGCICRLSAFCDILDSRPAERHNPSAKLILRRF